MKDDPHSPGHGELGELAEMFFRAPSQLQVGQECHLSHGNVLPSIPLSNLLAEPGSSQLWGQHLHQVPGVQSLL